MKIESMFDINKRVFFIRYDTVNTKWRLGDEKKKVIISIGINSDHIFYKLRGFSKNVPEKDVFSSIESAKEEILKRNLVS